MNILRKMGLAVPALLFLALIPRTGAADVPYRVANNQGDLYFGHISLADIKNDGLDPMVLRAGKNVPELAVLNFPITPGDTIMTSSARRCEIQFDTGTIVRLDVDTELKVETILAQTLTSLDSATNLSLAKGRVFIMYRDYNSRELFQVLTSNAAVKLNRDCVIMIQGAPGGPTDVQVKSGKASVLYGAASKSTSTKKLGKLERVLISADDRLESASFLVSTDFEKWNEEINENFNALHKGQNLLPKPVMRYSPGIVYFAQKWSNIYGEWLWDDLYGYVWRPYYNDTYPWGNWRPYFYGSWTEAQGQLFWVPQEAWGWVPYHLGIWTWDKKSGWIWIPGSVFSSAWVTWGYFDGPYFWRPWAFSDWWMWSLGYDDLFLNSAFSYFDWLMLAGLPTDNVVSGPPPAGRGGGNVLTKISKNQLAQPKSTLPIPKELKGMVKNTLKALARGDERIVSALQATAQARAFIRPEDIGAPRINEKAVGLDKVTFSPEGKSFREQFYDDARTTNPAGMAAFDLERSLDTRAPYTTPASLRVSIPVPEPAGPAVRSERPSPAGGERAVRPAARVQPDMRFRDWNPDIKQALRQGLTIVYSSLTNEVRCPQLGIGSHDVVQQMHSSSGSYFAGSSGLNSGSSSARGTETSTSSTRSTSSTQTTSSSTSSSGGAVKK